MQNMANEVPGLPFEYSLESISSPALFRPAFTSSTIDAAGGVYATPSMAHCPGLITRTSMTQKPRSPLETMISLDAPTQPRKYVTPSATSRKDVPSFFNNNKQRSQSIPSEGEEDELEEERPGIPHNDQEEIKKRRRKNTIAARKSRMKKLEQRMALEQTVERLTAEREIWRTRALTLSSLLTSHGIPCPDFND